LAKNIILILGGARSGKSSFAQELAKELSDKVLFVATGEPLDEEMQSRIEAHQKDRPGTWRTLESPVNISPPLKFEIGDAEVVIIDCLTLLVANNLGKELDYTRAEEQVLAEINELNITTSQLNITFIIVSNEVGTGLVPDNKLGRIYRDLLGKANQLVARNASDVYLMIAGIPTRIKGN